MDDDTASMTIPGWLGCPICRGELEKRQQELYCAQDDLAFPIADGIFRLLPPEKEEEAEKLSAEYRERREQQGWRSLSADEIASLPEKSPEGWDDIYWPVRSQSYEVLTQWLGEKNGELDGPLRVADLGAGIGWLAGYLAAMGHEVIALDLSCDGAFGLGAAKRFREARGLDFALAQGDLESPPIQEGQLDLLIYNASLHYAADLSHSLSNGAHLLKPTGTLVIMDSPVVTEEPVFQSEGWRGGRQLAREKLYDALADAGLRYETRLVRRGLRWKLRHFRAKLMTGMAFDLPYIEASCSI